MLYRNYVPAIQISLYLVRHNIEASPRSEHALLVDVLTTPPPPPPPPASPTLVITLACAYNLGPEGSHVNVRGLSGMGTCVRIVRINRLNQNLNLYFQNVLRKLVEMHLA